jgi:tRNA(Ile)-lysidine synthase
MIINSCTEFIKKSNLLSKKNSIIIGLSGGPDSVFLLYLLNILKTDYDLTLIAAHLDHQWRPRSADDVIFCAEICQKLGITFISRKVSDLTITIKKDGSQEALGRTLRRHFLQGVCREYNADAIALAHHEQDQQETFFIRLIRGTTLSGLIGMQPRTGYYIRPLLQTSKKDILAYLEQHTIPYLTDPTNVSESYLRNRIRLNVLPALQKADPRFDKNFLRTLESLQETEQFLQNLTEKTYTQLESLENNVHFLNLCGLLNLDDYLRKRVILFWLIENKVHFTPTESLLNEMQQFLLNKKSNSHALHTTWLIKKKHNKICIIKK